ncbi:hypothetical protein RJ639_042072 [Escallonia herrerae]|uniref:Uncharacterized protein n=1 Tax=Escallonia herrerae TaxID=1293975 RepID=A0AA88WGW3_9ASTE|nr:hypothetical protein RJ639_042072 [Escallonia herrerae]
MEPETLNSSEQTTDDVVPAAIADQPVTKHPREEGDDPDNETAKKQKIDESMAVEDQKLEEPEGSEPVDGETGTGPVNVGPKGFGSSVEIFDYFFKFLHYWTPNLNVNKYEHMMLLELLKKGHAEPEKKIGNGVHAFQVRFHPEWKSRCFFLVREDGSVDDFSFRKCVHKILPLPENMLGRSDVNKALGGGGGGGGGGRGGKFNGGGRGGGRGFGRGHGRGRGRGRRG